MGYDYEKVKRAQVTRATKRRKLFAKSMLEGKTQAESAIDAGYSPASANKVGSALAKHPDVIRDVQSMLAKHDLGLDKVGKALAEGLNEATADKRKLDFIEFIAELNGITRSKDKAGNSDPSGPNVIASIIGALEASRANGVIKWPKPVIEAKDVTPGSADQAQNPPEGKTP